MGGGYGVDEYEDTRLFIVSPPSFKLHPGDSKKYDSDFAASAAPRQNRLSD